MVQIPSGRRTLRRTAGAVGAVALLALGAAPAIAADPTTGVALGKLGPIDGVKPGGDVEVPATFTNTGSAALNKVYLSYSVTRGLSHTELPANCLRYEIPSYDEAPSRSEAVCEFEQTVEPGVVYAPEKTLTLKAAGHILYDRLRVVVGTEFTGPDENASDPVRGTAAAVKLVERPDDTPATGGGEDADAADIAVNADNTADFQVSGAELRGAVGDTVDLKVKFTNAGPGWVLRDLGVAPVEVLVDLPEGTTVTKDNGYCDRRTGGGYSCGTSQSWVTEGGGETYTFKVRIDKKVDGAKGSVALGGPARPYDKVPSNDKADITLDVTDGGSASGGSSTTSGGSASASGGSGAATAGGSDSTGGSATGSTGGSTGGSTAGSTGGATAGEATATGGAGSASTTGGGLANTGSGTVLPLAGAAVVAAGLGAGTVLLARRRAVRE
ncbi:hypothetical protein [Streptomyces corynorhini]|uniref:Gram-positive cocci surface proteins LPxTG domain-containing protein n=1 Tax=Streptomyces corynorhini TaxID=2282652 RepID=A0A370BJZ6_9ACTN|nr:hypothetical protein [Streptomyces corynorhini]RDG39936.1 hypothetical protein DVH02_01085 [Streptomyces corynorhini]